MKIYTLLNGEWAEWTHQELTAHLQRTGSIDALNEYKSQIYSLPKYLPSCRLPIAFAVPTPEGQMTFVFSQDL